MLVASLPALVSAAALPLKLLPHPGERFGRRVSATLMFRLLRPFEVATSRTSSAENSSGGDPFQAGPHLHRRSSLQAN